MGKVGETKLLVTCRTGDFINLNIIDHYTLFCARNKQKKVKYKLDNSVKTKLNENISKIKVNTNYSTERIWTSTNGRQITARAVSKSDNGVTLKHQDGRRVEVAFTKLSPIDVEWVKKWEAPIFTVSAKFKKANPFRDNTVVRVFVFDCSTGKSLEIREENLPSLISALQKALELGNIERDDIKDYHQIIPVGKLSVEKPRIDSLQDPSEEVIFRIEEGKAYCSGSVLKFSSPEIPIEEIPAFIDFIETFSVREWDKQQEEIKRRFE